MSEIKKLAKNTSFLAGTRLVQFIVGLLRIKISALILGPIGMGVIDQLTFLSQKVSSFTLLGMSEAVVKQIAENKNEEGIVRKTICAALKSYILLVAGFMLISMSVLFVFSDPLTGYVFGTKDYIAYFYVGVFTLPVLILDTIPFAILKAFNDVKTIAKARIIVVLINIVFAIPLILNFKLLGAVIFVPISYATNLTVNFYFANKNYFRKYRINIVSVFRTKVVRNFVKEQILFSGYGLTVGSYLIISEFVCRSIVVSKLGVDSIGLYSPVIMWASIFTGFILPALSTYLYPRFCEIKNNSEISEILNDALRISTLSLMPLLFLGIPYRGIFIELFYSDAFIASEKYLPYHFLGIIFYVWWYIFAQSLTPTGRIKTHGVFMIFFLTLDILTTYIFVRYFNLYGWMMKHILSPFVFFWIYSFYSKLKMDFKISTSNVRIMGYAILITLLLILLLNLFPFGDSVNFVLGPMMLIVTYFLLEESEKDFIKRKVSLLKSYLIQK